MPSLVDVVITVTRFTANPSAVHPEKDRPLETCGIESELQLAGANAIMSGDWKLDNSGQVFICPPPDVGLIAIRKRGNDPVEFTFTIASAPGVPALRPTAIVFEQQKYKHDGAKTREDPNGLKNFAAKAAAGNQLPIAAKCLIKGPSKNRSEHAAPHWKFWIRVETTDLNGNILNGWIDPGIENSEDMSPP